MNLFELVAVLSLNKKGYEEGLASAKDEAESFGSKLKSGLGTAAKVGGIALAAVGAGATAVTKSLISSSSAVAELGDHIDKQSQKIGISAKAYQEWDFILTHSGASVDSLQASMKTLSNQAQEQAEEFQKLGISEEEVANSSPEELFERVIKSLQGMEASTERTAIASKLLGRGATELAPVLNATSDDIEGMRQQAHELGKVLSDEAVKSGAAYEDSLYNLQTSMAGIKNQMSANLLPAIVSVMDGLTGIFSGDDSAIDKLSKGIEQLATKITQAIPKIAEVASRLISTFGKAILQTLPQVSKSAVEIVKTLTSTISENLPMIFDLGLDIIMALIDGLIDSIPQIVDGLIHLAVKIIEKLPTIIIKLVEAIPKVVEMLVKGLIDNLPVIIEGLISLVLALVDHLPEILLGFIDALPRIIDMVINGLLDNLPMLIEGAIQIVVGLVSHLPEIIAGLIAAIPSIISSILGAFGGLGEALGGVFGGAVEVAGGVLGELGTIAEGVFNWIGTLMDDPAKALEEAFDGIKDYAVKVFQSVQQIITGIFDLITAKQEEAEAKARHEKAVQAREAVANEKGLVLRTDENGTNWWEVADEAQYLSAYGGRDALGLLQAKGDQKLDVSGTVTIEGVNSEGEFVESAQYVYNYIGGELRREVRR